MTSDQKLAPQEPSDDDGHRPYGGVESAGGAWHPYMIEVQDFAAYALIVDVRSEQDYRNDHIPGAVRLEPPADLVEAARTKHRWRTTVDVPSALQVMVDATHADDDLLLLYDGYGGLIAEPLAIALRQLEWDVDVLAGGWINYRRWIQAGLDVLPRLFEWRLIAGASGSDAAAVLRALEDAGHQVVDIEALAEVRDSGSSSSDTAAQPSQPWFESQLVDAMRKLSGMRPVWTTDVPPSPGSLAVPNAMLAALSIAPIADLEIGAADAFSRQPAEGNTHRHRLPPLVVEALEPEVLAAAVRQWLPAPDES